MEKILDTAKNLGINYEIFCSTETSELYSLHDWIVIQNSQVGPVINAVPDIKIADSVRRIPCPGFGPEAPGFRSRCFSLDVPLILMNSVHTHDTTVELIKKYKDKDIQIRCFEQSVFPLIRSDTHEPLPQKPFSMNSKKHWCVVWYAQMQPGGLGLMPRSLPPRRGVGLTP